MPEEHPDNMPDKGILLLVPGNPNHLMMPIVLADVLPQQYRREGKSCGSSCGADIQDSMGSPGS